ncbi:MAG: 4-aminobutyrate--2-oxoglutarate transaminase [Gammaproteobacteria bacterium]|nr:MAG: 4-aminobutyrate--2-oxoglutarate transaminase [Gammaproteobacteria bacterium]
MSHNDNLLKRRQAALPKGLATAFPVFADKAENAQVWDVEGNCYLDFVGGISVLNTGHSHPKIVKAVTEQVQKFSHTAANIVLYPGYVELAEKLNAAVPGDTPKKTVFFTTGAEALENAVKISRAKTGRHAVITFVGGFHGRTLFTLGMTGKVEPYKKLFGPFPSSIYHVPFPAESLGISEDDSIKALEKLFKADVDPSNVAAIVIEPVQGEGGFYPVTPNFAKRLRQICDDNGIMLVCDEVQTCFGRTGHLFATERLGIEPDLITAAKSLAGGYPLSAVIGKADVMDAPLPGGLGGTYAGNPVAIASALAVYDVIKEEKLLECANEIGEKFTAMLNEAKSAGAKVGDVRITGAMIAFDLVDDDGKPDAKATADLIASCFNKGLLIASCGLYGNSIRVMVPLTVEAAHLDEALDIIKKELA